MRNEIPSAMQSARRWLVWKLIPHKEPGKKPRKVPFYLDGTQRRGELDAPADLAKLGTFDEALQVLATGNYTGLGFALGADGPGCWQGIDLDHTDTRPELAALVELLPGYVEWSPSLTGVHAIGYGSPVKALGSNRSGIEVYTAGRYFTVTGNAIGGDIEDLSKFIGATLAPLHTVAVVSADTATRGERAADAPASLTDANTVKDLRSALASLRSDERETWVRIGLALKSMGDTGRGLWLEWSQGSEKYDAADAARVWESFKPTATDPRAVFAEAQRGGWVNPKKSVSRETPAPVVPIAPRVPVQAAATAKPDDWPEPADLSAGIPSAPYPVDAFPEPARSAVIEYHRFGRQPLALVSSSALAQMALAAQALADVSFRQACMNSARWSGNVGAPCRWRPESATLSLLGRAAGSSEVVASGG
ncbi:PriCT-2 domain-containing protein, partial [uncultured Thiodictyon sp.]|uniref:PriCT-2 domain-containing protein n=1 Tax=uncultured Thiodictyon sp. TaxID=1846217 RepID=UPI0025F1D9A4